ncbi:hypothetical protein [Sphingobacterium haloxyli]|uniref:DUF4890 domain-containing protein n=1 Tax=Sphingobacterium haloxyli TaxID=2100533 RepID=A0A2S9J6C5_9SPHI|nr:hypothetical protein [Sphingobacterium haloxyli]PRD48322.1 hypothetical protein C5745_03715 [Sphingobacterium haloxyli]
MKKTLSLAVLFAGISLATFAQEEKGTRRPITKDRKPRMEKRIHGTPEEVAKLKTVRLDKHLKFTDAQRAEVYAVQLAQAKQAAVHREEMKNLHDRKRGDMKDSRAKMNEILTAEQKELLERSYAQRHQGNFKGTKREFKKRGMIEKKMTGAENTEG